MKNAFRIITLLILQTFVSIQAQQGESFYKPTDDDNSKYTDVGNIGITITNFGTYGHGFSLWPEQPSCEYPKGSGIEHIYDGGLWVGGFTADDSLGNNINGPFVSTGVIDFSSATQRGSGLEFTNSPGSFVEVRSSLPDSKFFSPKAISHQDFIMDFSDTSTTLSNGEPILLHRPLGVSVHLETYAWNYPFADYFVIFNYYITNVSHKYIDSFYVALWTDAVVRNTIVTSPRTGGFFNHGGNGFNDSLNLAYEFDADGDPGFTDSYIGVQFLGASRQVDSVNYVNWQYRNTTNPNYFSPQDDIERYKKLEGFFGGSNRYNYGISPDDLKIPSNRSILLSTGNFKNLAPGDTINVTFAMVAAKKNGSDPASLDTEYQKEKLYTNAGWAIRAYRGEDRNGNGILDPGEDSNGDGILTRYILPSPPKTPFVKVVPGNQKTTIYWDDRAEFSVDPISGEMDFEGYRIYRTNAGFDLSSNLDILESLVTVAEFDSADNNIGYDTGFPAFIHLDEPVTFPGDTIEYKYKFEIDNLLNGWQYLFTVTAFDRGDEENGLPSLESSSLSSLNRILPGTPATSDDDVKIGVYPNPYYGNAYWDGPSERLRKIYFYNLPEECEIIIYTLSGDVVKHIYHDQNSNGADLRWFETYAKDATQKMSGGEHAWDLISDHSQAIASGLYIFSVEDKKTGNIKTGKFLIIK